MTAPLQLPAVPELILGHQSLPLDETLSHEWLVTNGLGGYAAGTVALCNTRKYHGFFTPSLFGHGRMVMLAHLDERVQVGGATFRLDGMETTDGRRLCCADDLLEDFRLVGLIPHWTFQAAGARLLRRVVMVHGENTVYLIVSHLGGPPALLRLRPYPTFRSHEGALERGDRVPAVTIREGRVELKACPESPELRLRLISACAAPFVALDEATPPLCYRVDRSRGYDHSEVLRSPGYFECQLEPGQTLALAATTQDWDLLDRDPLSLVQLELEREARVLERAPARARTGTAARLVLAADQFLIEPANRPQDEAWARATGQDARSVIAGYHWFTDWGRDSMISLDGLTLATGRTREAAALLRTFQHYLRDGLIPNFFPDGEREGVYHTADATLWYFHALNRYLEESSDEVMLHELFPSLEQVIAHHVRGTKFNIHVDPQDGLLHQGAAGYQLTWMDAKVDGWVVTPRRGKAVEINALWFNALSLMADWATRLDAEPGPYRERAAQVRASFNARFWNPEAGCLYDVVDTEAGGVDPAVRPNQVFAISLHHPVLERRRWEPVLNKVRDELLTPVGLRSLSPRHPDYKARYDGDLRSRDAAYHQGTVWPWLIGHYVDALMKLRPDKSVGRNLLLGLERHLTQTCIGQVGEIFDASPPFRPRGCVAQAWSVAEMLRAWLKTS